MVDDRSLVSVFALGCSVACWACGDDTSATVAATTSSATGGAAGNGGSGAQGGASSGGAGGAPPCVLASSWQVVDDYTHSPTENSNPAGIAVSSSGAVFVTGLVRVISPVTGLIRNSDDGGATWTSTLQGTFFPNDATADDAGNVYVIGGLAGDRVVKKSADGGATWPTVDQAPIGMSMSACSTGYVAAGPAGAVYTGGSCDDLGWTVRRSLDSGVNWEEVLTGFEYPPATQTRMEDVGVDTSGQAFAAGYGRDAGGVLHWLVLRGAAQGSFTTSDDYQLTAGEDAFARRLGGRARMFAAGSASDGNTTHGVLREAGSAGWSTIDQFPGDGAAVYDGGQQMVLVGSVVDLGGVTRVVTRKSGDGGVTWMALDEYTYVMGRNTFSGQIAADPQGNVYAAVAAKDANDITHWIVRKLACE